MDDQFKPHRVKRAPLSAEVQEALKEFYRTNPYPTRDDYDSYSKELTTDFDQIRTWFNNRRRRDWRNGILCRKCRFFKGPINDNLHEVEHRPCIAYWISRDMSFHTTKLDSSHNDADVSSSLETSVDREKLQQPLFATATMPDAQETIENHLAPLPDAIPVPPIVPHTVQQSLCNFQQSHFNSEQALCFYPQPSTSSYPMDMSTTGNNWTMRTNGGTATYWPSFPFPFAQSSDLPTMQTDYHSMDFRSSHVHRAFLFPAYHENNFPYAKSNQLSDSCYYEEGAPNSEQA